MVNEARDIVVKRALRALVLTVTTLTIAAIIAVFVSHAAPSHNKFGFCAFACWMFAPGLVVWLHPKLSIAILWSLVAWFGFLMAVNLTWPGSTVAYLMTPVLVLLLFVVPIGGALYRAAIVRADARAAKIATPELPAARVVNRRAV